MEWREIPGFQGYEVSETGLVRSYWTAKQGLRGRPMRMLTQSINRSGYTYVVLSKEGERHNLCVHRVVALAFIGDLAPGMDVHHKNGDEMDNRLSNLEVITHKKNVQRIRNIKKPLDRDQVLDIRRRRKNGESLYEIADDYHLSPTCVSQISRGKTYVEFGGPLTFGRRGGRS